MDMRDNSFNTWKKSEGTMILLLFFHIEVKSKAFHHAIDIKAPMPPRLQLRLNFTFQF